MRRRAGTHLSWRYLLMRVPRRRSTRTRIRIRVDRMTSGVGATRNGGYVPGQALLDRVLIPGWQQRSVWGWDPAVGSLYARLWQNIDHDTAPRYEVDGRAQILRHPGQLALALLETTPLPPLALIEGLGLGSKRVLGNRARVRCLLEQPGSSSPHHEGITWGAQWVLGQSTQCPGTHLPWLLGVSPTAQVIHAEHVYALGRLARTATQRRGLTASTREVHHLQGIIAVLDGALLDRPPEE